ncbi:hypothetical protein ACQ4M3_02885 [Leptolyngbya sp. AN03gr2]|uniref:hypothetical protein n=1 Tax=unclassified Leptolyngbya TaxID=2650499 RepID=UPI003D314E69
MVDLNHSHPVLREEGVAKCGWNPFEGWDLTGWAQVTIVNGQVVYDRGKFNEEVRGRALRFDA